MDPNGWIRAVRHARKWILTIIIIITVITTVTITVIMNL